MSENTQVKKIGRYDGYRTTAFFGFNIPKSPNRRSHFHVPASRSRYTPLRRSRSLEDLFVSQRPSGSRIQQIKRSLLFDGVSPFKDDQCFRDAVNQSTLGIQTDLDGFAKIEAEHEDKQTQTGDKVIPTPACSSTEQMKFLDLITNVADYLAGSNTSFSSSFFLETIDNLIASKSRTNISTSEPEKANHSSVDGETSNNIATDQEDEQKEMDEFEQIEKMVETLENQEVAETKDFDTTEDDTNRLSVSTCIHLLNFLESTLDAEDDNSETEDSAKVVIEEAKDVVEVDLEAEPSELATSEQEHLISVEFEDSATHVTVELVEAATHELEELDTTVVFEEAVSPVIELPLEKADSFGNLTSDNIDESEDSFNEQEQAYYFEDQTIELHVLDTTNEFVSCDDDSNLVAVSDNSRGARTLEALIEEEEHSECEEEVEVIDTPAETEQDLIQLSEPNEEQKLSEADDDHQDEGVKAELSGAIGEQEANEADDDHPKEELVIVQSECERIIQLVLAFPEIFKEQRADSCKDISSDEENKRPQSSDSAKKHHRNFIVENIQNVSHPVKPKTLGNSSSIFCNVNPFADVETPEEIKRRMLAAKPSQTAKKPKVMKRLSPPTRRIGNAIKRKHSEAKSATKDIEAKLVEHCENQDKMNKRMDETLKRMNAGIKLMDEMQEEAECQREFNSSITANLSEEMSRLEGWSSSLVDSDD